MANEQTIRFVVCAAIRKGNLVIAGARHFDDVMCRVINAMTESFDAWESGFIDQKGVFLTREEAWQVADAAGQIRRPTGWEKGDRPRPAGVGDKEPLFSENLY